jgi:hypothetical protein
MILIINRDTKWRKYEGGHNNSFKQVLRGIKHFKDNSYVPKYHGYEDN